MSLTAEPRITDVTIDLNNLFREESFTDLTYVTIRRFTPVTPDGSVDPSREIFFTGMTQLMSPNGPVPIQCAIEWAKTLKEAAQKLPEAIEKAVQEMIAEAKEMQREEASRIVIPGQ
jgi:hypothetical protein